MTSRHPLERLLSAYRFEMFECLENILRILNIRDKFFLNGDSEDERDKVARWYELYGRDVIMKYRKTEVTDPVYSKAPTFREFVEFIVDLPITEYNYHWIPIYLLCMPCHFKYSIMARVDTLTQDSEQIFKSISVSDSLPREHITQGNTTDNTVSSYHSTISLDLLDQLLEIYKFDFLLFNYTVDEYYQFVSNQ